MTKREIAVLICKVLGIYAFINAVNSLPLILMPFIISVANGFEGTSRMEGVARWASVVNAVPLLLNVVAGVLLWSCANGLARRMVQDEKVETPIVIGSEIQIVAFSILGLFTLLQALPRIGQLVINLYNLSRQDALMRQNFQGTTASEVVTLVIQLALGSWLLLGSSGLVRLLQSFRSVGLDK